MKLNINSKVTTVNTAKEQHYHIVHLMEPESPSVAITSPQWSSPLLPAMFCLFLGEELDGFHLSSQEIVALLVRFYGFKYVPLDSASVEIELYTAREQHCLRAKDILQNPHLKKEGLKRAIRDCLPVGFDSFEALIVNEQ